jgi:hypothetical protein
MLCARSLATRFGGSITEMTLAHWSCEPAEPVACLDFCRTKRQPLCAGLHRFFAMRLGNSRRAYNSITVQTYRSLEVHA